MKYVHLFIYVYCYLIIGITIYLTIFKWLQLAYGTKTRHNAQFFFFFKSMTPDFLQYRIVHILCFMIVTSMQWGGEFISMPYCTGLVNITRTYVLMLYIKLYMITNVWLMDPMRFSLLHSLPLTKF